MTLNNASTSGKKFFETPLKRTPDSGIAEDTPSSNSRGSTSNNSFDMIKKIDNVKKNYRKNMITSDDSD